MGSSEKFPVEGPEKSKKTENREGNMLTKFKNFLRENFIIGIIFSGPIFGTIYILFLFFSFLDRSFGGFYDRLIGFHIPGAGLVTMFVAVILVGIFARTYLASFFLQIFERNISKVPLAGTIYSAFKNVADMFQHNKKGFGRPALLILDKAYFLVFEISSDERTSTVLLPSVPNPTTGFVFFVPKSHIFYPKLSADEAMKFIFSFGSYSRPISDAIAKFSRLDEITKGSNEDK